VGCLGMGCRSSIVFRRRSGEGSWGWAWMEVR